MQVTKIIPTMPEVLREAIIVAVGALIAAAVVRALPAEYRRMFSLTGGNEP